MFLTIMPVFNRPKHTIKTIESFYQNSYYKHEMVVLNDKSNEETSKTLEDLQKKYEFILHENNENIGVGGSKNKGYEIAKEMDILTEYIYFTDNDVFFLKDWDKVLYQTAIFNGWIGLVGGGCHPYLKTNKNYDFGYTKFGTKDAVSGYSHLLKTDLFVELGMYDSFDGDGKKTGRSEDWAICQKIKEKGMEVGSITPELVLATGKLDSYGDLAVGHETYTSEHANI